MSVKNRLFAKYGHDCKIPHSLDDLPMFKSGRNIHTQIKNLLTRWRMASEINYRSLAFLRSQKRLDMEHRMHLKSLYIIHPFSDLRKWWETFMIVILLIQFIMIPIDIAFFERPMVFNFTDDDVWRFIRMACDYICLTDVAVTFFTGYCEYKTKTIVMSHRKIAFNYLFSYFVPDFLSSMPTEWEAFGEVSEGMRGVNAIFTHMSVLKLMRFFTFLRYLKQFSDTYAIDHSRYRLSMIAICFCLYYHIICCLSIYIVTLRFYNDPNVEVPTTIYRKDRTDMPINLLYDIKTTYFYMLYQSTQLINSASFMIAGSKKLVLFSIVIWIISRIINMYLLALIVDVIISKSAATQKYYEMLSELKDYMGHKQLPAYLQERILGYYEFRFQKSYFRESEIMNTISGHLRQEVVMYSCRRLVENVDFFKDLPLPLLVRIVSNLKLEVFLTNDVILKVNTIGDSMYFIGTGTVAIFSRSGIEVCHLSDGDHFGEVALVTSDETRIAAVVAVETTEVYRLNRIDFVRAIMPYPDLFYKIQRIALERWEITMNLEERKGANMK